MNSNSSACYKYPQENLEEIESTKPVVYNEGAIFLENINKPDKIVLGIKKHKQ